jgi:ABC-2 type transport system ATP-binding protein
MTATAPTVDSRGSDLPEVAVLVDDLVVRFGEIEAVAGVSFAVAAGEVFGLLGPNGAGKTTTIRVLTTLLRPTNGRAFVAGHDVEREGLAVRRSIGYVPQAISIDGALTAAENLEFYGRVTGVPRRERRDRIAQAVDAMDLGSFLDRLGRTLSGGMLRRLEIATALLNRPDVLFLDEPTSNLDPAAKKKIEAMLAAFAADGMTLVMSTHNLGQAKRLATRVILLDGGRVRADLPTEHFFAEHADLPLRHHSPTLPTSEDLP